MKMSKKIVFISVWGMVTIWAVQIDRNKPADEPQWPAAPYALTLGWIPAMVAAMCLA